MSDASIETGHIIEADEHGVVGEHPAHSARPFFAAPALADQTAQRNGLSVDVAPIACFNVGDVLFEFDSSVLREEAGRLLSKLPDLRRKRPGVTGELPLVSVFGHSDPTGDEEYNKTLAGRRATAVYALLVHDAKLWDKLYANAFGGDDWSKKMDLKGIADRVGLPRSSSRLTIFAAYMKALCPEPLQKSDFLGRGSDPGGKADYQGCGEANPLLLLSAQESKTLPKDSRDLANLINRRVVVFLFRPELRLAVKEWPCPRASEGPASCRKRFFLDAKQRLTPGPVRKRHFGPTDETFGCRFYDRIGGRSPCEQFLRMYKIRLFDTLATPMPGAPFTVNDGKRTVTGVTDADAFATVRDLKVPADVHVTWRDPNDESRQFSLTVHVDVEGDDDAAAARRLHNLGYERLPTLADNVREFQVDHAKQFPNMTPNGQLDDATRSALSQVHEDCAPAERPRDDAAATGGASPPA